MIFKNTRTHAHTLTHTFHAQMLTHHERTTMPTLKPANLTSCSSPPAKGQGGRRPPGSPCWSAPRHASCRPWTTSPSWSWRARGTSPWHWTRPTRDICSMPCIVMRRKYCLCVLFNNSQSLQPAWFKCWIQLFWFGCGMEVEYGHVEGGDVGTGHLGFFEGAPGRDSF